MTTTPKTERALITGTSRTNFTTVVPSGGNPPRQLGSVFCANIGTSEARITLAILPSGSTQITDEDILIPGKEIPANDLFVIEHHDYFILNPGDKVVAFSSLPGAFNVHIPLR